MQANRKEPITLDNTDVQIEEGERIARLLARGHGQVLKTALTEGGAVWLGGVLNRLRIYAQELQRIEKEGGAVPRQKRDDLFNVILRIDHILHAGKIVSH